MLFISSGILYTNLLNLMSRFSFVSYPQTFYVSMSLHISYQFNLLNLVPT